MWKKYCFRRAINSKYQVATFQSHSTFYLFLLVLLRYSFALTHLLHTLLHYFLISTFTNILSDYFNIFLSPHEVLHHIHYEILENSMLPIYEKLNDDLNMLLMESKEMNYLREFDVYFLNLFFLQHPFS